MLSFLKKYSNKKLYKLKNLKWILNKIFFKFGFGIRFVDLQSIILYVNSTCNLKCVMCDVGQRNNKGIDKLRTGQKNINLSIDLLNKLLNDSYIKKRKLNFNLLMTEPLLHPHIYEIIRLIKKNKHNVNLTTNGYLLPEKAKGLILAGLDSIQVSIDGPEKIHDKIRGIKGAYKRAIKGIRIINQNKNIKISINYTLSCINDSEILNFFSAINKEGIKIDLIKIQFMDFVSREMMKKQNEKYDIKQTESCLFEAVRPEKVNIKELARQLNSIKNNYGNIKRIEIVPYLTNEKELSIYFNTNGEKLKNNSKCFLPWNQITLTTDGKTLIHMRCFNYVYGDFNKDIMGNIFHNKPIKAFRKKLKNANFCFPACTRCCGVMVYGHCVS